MLGLELYLNVSSGMINPLHTASVQSLKGYRILIIANVDSHTADRPFQLSRHS